MNPKAGSQVIKQEGEEGRKEEKDLIRIICVTTCHADAIVFFKSLFFLFQVILACVIAATAGAPAAQLALAPYAGAIAPVAYATAGLGLPEARAYALPPVRQVAEAPIVETIVEPVEQWGYKVAY